MNPPEINIRGKKVVVDLMYPRIEGNISQVEVGLCDVRAADSILIEYDFERDGYSIKQASTFSWDADDKICDSDWEEVAFVQAWAREKPEMMPESPEGEKK